MNSYGAPDQKVALVTGAGAGIGRACALRFAAAGYSVLVSDLAEASAQETCRQIEHSGGVAQAALTDVASADSCEAMARSALECWGRIDVLVVFLWVRSLIEFRSRVRRIILLFSRSGSGSLFEGAIDRLAVSHQQRKQPG